MENKDILIHYMIHKKEDSSPKIRLMIKCVYDYIQNNPVYFKYEPTFYQNTLLFGIIGFKRCHNHLQKILSLEIDKLGGKLNVILEYNPIDNYPEIL